MKNLQNERSNSSTTSLNIKKKVLQPLLISEWFVYKYITFFPSMLTLISYYCYNLTIAMVHMPFVLMVEEFINFCCFLVVNFFYYCIFSNMLCITEIFSPYQYLYMCEFVCILFLYWSWYLRFTVAMHPRHAEYEVPTPWVCNIACQAYSSRET